MTGSPTERFLDEAVRRGLLTAPQADDCRRLATALADVQVELPIDEIAVRRGFATREQCDALKRALARLRVGKYEVIERLGEGASGIVWKARDTVLDRVVALKVVPSRGKGERESESAGRRDRFLREARTAVAFNHERIVRGLDCGEADGYLYFAMEFVPGGSLEARIAREGRIAEDVAVRAALDVVLALRHVAASGVVHRDLKPANLLLDDQGRVKVADLGLAKPAAEERERGAAEGLAAGTPLYIPPEQIRDGDRVDWRADVYSLGATLFHMVAGRPPFRAEKGRDLLRRHIEEAPPSPREFAPDLTPGIAAVILKMLQKDPADRYRSFDDLEEDLRAVLEKRPPLRTVSFAPKESPSVDVAAARAAAPRRRNLRRVAVVAGVVLGLVAIGVGRELQREFERKYGGHPAGTAPGDGETAADRQPVRPAPDAGRTPPASAEDRRAADAAEALRAAERRIAVRPHDRQATRAEYLYVAERHAGTPAAAEASSRAREVTAAIEAAAAEELDRRRLASAAAAADGRHAAAARILEEFPSDLDGTAAAQSAAEEGRRCRDDGLRRKVALIEQACALAAERRFDDADRRLDDAERVGLTDRAADLAFTRRVVAESRTRHAEDREAQRATFDHVHATALLTLGQKGLDAALRWLDVASRDVDAWSAEVARVRGDLESAARAPRGEPAAGASAAEIRSALLAKLASGAVSETEPLFSRLQAAGSPCAEEREALRRVRAHLETEVADLILLAEQSRAAKRTDEAEECVRRALARLPRHPGARVAAASILADRGRVDAAVAEIEAVLAEPQAPPEAHLRLAQALLLRRKGDERAEQELRLFLVSASADDPRRGEAREALDAVVLVRERERIREVREAMRRSAAKDDHAAVVADAETILGVVPGDPEALIALAEAHDACGRPRLAARALRTLIDGPSKDVRTVRASALLERIEKRWAATPDAKASAAAARAALDRGDVSAAAAFDRVLVTAPFLEEALLGAAEGRLLRSDEGATDDVRAALELLGDLIQRNARSARARALRAAALLRMGDAAGALDEALAAAGIDPALHEAELVAGQAALETKDWTAALDHFQRSLDLRRTPDACFGRALAWERQGSLGNARSEASTLCTEFLIPGRLDRPVRALLARLGLEYEPPPSSDAPSADPGATEDR